MERGERKEQERKMEYWEMLDKGRKRNKKPEKEGEGGGEKEGEEEGWKRSVAMNGWRIMNSTSDTRSRPGIMHRLK